MKLLMHPASPNVRAVRVTAALSDIQLELQLVDAMNGEQSRLPFRAINPNGLFPVLIDDGFVLWETVPIMQYVAAKRPGNTLWPNDEQKRADICRWQCWNLAHWSPALRVYIFENYFKQLKGLGAPDVGVIKKGESNFHNMASILDQQVREQEYLTGPEVTLADISTASYLMYAAPAQIPLAPYAHVLSWLGRITSLPAWNDTV
jgi:glutathione S-transferase